MDTVLRDMPWVAALGPIVGLFLNALKGSGKLAGFGLLLAAIGVSAAVIGAYGLAQGWDADQWRGAPFAVLLSVAFASVTGTTAAHAKDTFMEWLAWDAPEPEVRE